MALGAGNPILLPALRLCGVCMRNFVRMHARPAKPDDCPSPAITTPHPLRTDFELPNASFRRDLCVERERRGGDECYRMAEAQERAPPPTTKHPGKIEHGAAPPQQPPRPTTPAHPYRHQKDGVVDAWPLCRRRRPSRASPPSKAFFSSRPAALPLVACCC